MKTDKRFAENKFRQHEAINRKTVEVFRRIFVMW